MDLSSYIQEHFDNMNNLPREDFLGLSPNAMHYIVYDPYHDESPIKFKENISNEALDRIPLFRLFEELLLIIQGEKEIKLTKTGALPVKVVFELYEKKILTDDFIEEGISKLSREEDSMAIQNTRMLTELSKVVRKLKGKWLLTKATEKLLETNNRNELFKKFFQTYTDKFLWAYNDAYDDEQVGQFAWAFTLIALKKHGKQEQSAKFYAGKYAKAFPALIDNIPPGQYSSQKDSFYRCYQIRCLNRFLGWFGFIEIVKQKSIISSPEDKVIATVLIDDIFEFSLG